MKRVPLLKAKDVVALAIEAHPEEGGGVELADFVLLELYRAGYRVVVDDRAVQR